MKKIKALLYCTKEKNKYDRLVRDEHYGKTFYLYGAITENFESLNGTIVAECDFEVEELTCCCVPYRNNNNLGYEYFLDNGVYKVEWNKNNIENGNPEAYKKEGVVFERSDRYIDTMFKDEDLKKMCLSPQQLLDYIKLGKNGYGIHIKNLHIFDKPRELSDFNKIIETTYGEEPDETITKAPQNMMRCCYEKNPKEWETGVLISIQPQWMCKILNGEKDIEVRKQVLKCMKGILE